IIPHAERNGIMSAHLFPDDIVFAQRFLKCCSLYNGDLSGVWDSKTDVASSTFETASDAIAIELGTFDTRSERSIRTLQPKAQRAARGFLKRVLDAGINARIISGTRTYSEQDALFRKGRFGDAWPIVTKARRGQR